MYGREKAETFEHQDVEVNIYYDTEPANPLQEWDGMATVVHWHPDYRLGDRVDRPYDEDEYEAILQHVRDHYGATIIMPLYMYDHSGITVSTTPFSCQWDSGQVGVVFMSADALKTGWGDHPYPEGEELERVIEGSVKVFDQYLTGDVYGYVVDEDGRDEESCWGFYGEDHVKEEAQSIAEYVAKQRAKRDEVTRKTMAVWRD